MPEIDSEEGIKNLFEPYYMFSDRDRDFGENDKFIDFCNEWNLPGTTKVKAMSIVDLAE